MKEELQA
jgi:hypothetical protein